MELLHFYRKPALSETKKKNLLSIVRQSASPDIKDIETEHCFNIEATAPLTNKELNTLRWLLAETFEPENFSGESFLIEKTAPPTHPSPSRGEGKGGGEIATPEPALSSNERLLRFARNDKSEGARNDN